MAKHPFEVGKHYRTERGPYTVLRIEEPWMVIQYNADGRQQRDKITFFETVWERIELDADLEDEDERPRRTPPARPAPVQPTRGRQFHGLHPTDFQSGTAGTHWRGREDLGGALAASLSHFSGRPFESHSVPRRPEVFVALPNHFSEHANWGYAKFFLRLNADEAFYGFWIEKGAEPDEHAPIWDWPAFLAAISAQPALQNKVAQAMQQFTLQWRNDLSAPPNYPIAATTITPGDSLDWPTFLDALRTIPPAQHCDLYLGRTLDKEDALALTARLANDVAQVYFALLPLYLASVKSG